jgi:hypothetical protein
MNVLGWMKSHWFIVACIAVMLVAPPVAWYFSSSMARKTSAARESEAGSLFNEVRSLRTTYALPSVSPGAQRVELASEPNERITAWFREQNEQLTGSMAQVIEEAVEFNRRGREPVIEGVLPTPPADPTEHTTRLIDFAGAFVPSPSRPGQSVYERMLVEIDAGGPVPAAELSQTLRSEADREIQRRQSDSPDGQISLEEEEEIRQRLVQMRLSRYSARAREISLYANLSAFPSAADRSPYFPREQEGGVPTVEQCFRWQWDAWLAEDVLAAIRTANSDEGGRLLPVEQAPVKRLLRVEGPPPRFLATPDQGLRPDEEASGATDPGADPAGALIEPTFDAYLTGRPPETLNQLYDVRIVSVLAHVDSARLPQVIEAFGRTNFMTVIGVTISPVDLDAELGNGYFYGDDHVVQVQFNVEVLFLRQWTKQYMPPSIRTRLGLPETDQDPDGLG